MANSTDEKRAGPRKPMHGIGEIVDPNSGGTFPVKLLDISSAGISMLSQVARTEGSLLILRFEVDGQQLRGVIRIAYCVKHSLTDAYRLGAEFRDWETQYLEIVQNILDA